VSTPVSRRPLPPPGHVNLRLVISYCGTPFSGYQAQPHAKTVQDALQEMWATFARGERPVLYGCSRLDAGVHAGHFVLNFFTSCEAAVAIGSEEAVLRSLNGILQAKMMLPIRVQAVEHAEPSFNARFDAHGKHYRYLVWHGFRQHALLTPRAWVVRSRQAPHALAEAAQLFRGSHDFAAFRASDCAAKKTVRTIDAVHVWQHRRFPELMILDFFGEAFLKNMIRNVVGTSVDVATGKLSASDVEAAFLHGVREKTGQCAPAHALTLERVYYDEAEYETHARDGLFELFH